MVKNTIKRRILSLVLAVIMIVGIVPISSIAVNPTPTGDLENLIQNATLKSYISADLAGGGPFTEVTEGQGYFAPSNVVDGEDSTYAYAASGKYVWRLEAQMDAAKTVNQVVVTFAENGEPASYDILGSADGENWTVLKRTQGDLSSTVAVTRTINFTNTEVKYIAISGTAHEYVSQKAGRLMLLAEVAVYNNPDVDISENYASGKPVTLYGSANTVVGSSDPIGGVSTAAENVTDNDYTTFARYADWNGSVEIDLGEVKSINNVDVSFAGQPGYNYGVPDKFTVSVAGEDRQFTNVAVDVTPRQRVAPEGAGWPVYVREEHHSINFDEQGARYVRITDASCTGPDDQMQVAFVGVYGNNPQMPDAVNVALGKTVKAYSNDGIELGYLNSTTSDKYDFQNATDGIISTVTGENETIASKSGNDTETEYGWDMVVDLGAVKTNVFQVKAHYSTSSSPSYEILVSQDGEAWTSVKKYDADNNTQRAYRSLFEATRTVEFAAQNVRYVKLLDNSNTYANRITELEVYAYGDNNYNPGGSENPGGGETPGTPVNVAIGKTVKAYTDDNVELGYFISSTSNRYDLQHATDGIISTVPDENEAIADQVGNNSDIYLGWDMVVDLGAIKTNVYQVKAYYSISSSPSYEIQVSTDGLLWTSVKKYDGGNASQDYYSAGKFEPTRTADFEAQNVRYVKLLDNSGTGFNRITELEVYAYGDNNYNPGGSENPGGGNGGEGVRDPIIEGNLATGATVKAYNDIGDRIYCGVGEADGDETYALANMVDEDLDTSAKASDEGDTEGSKGWDAVIELTQAHSKVNTVRIDFENRNSIPAKYSVAVSLDSYSWTTIAEEFASTEVSKTITFDKQAIKFVKIEDLTPACDINADVMSIAEVQVVIDESLNTDKNYALGAYARAYTDGGQEMPNSLGSQIAGNADAQAYTREKATDGDENTFYYPSLDGMMTDVQGWDLVVDMGKVVKNIDTVEVVIKSFGARGKYEIQVSTDNANWVTVHSFEDNPGDNLITQTAFFKARDVRYIRLEATQSGKSAMRIHEVRAFATGDIFIEDTQKTNIAPDAISAKYILNDATNATELSHTVDATAAIDGDKMTSARPTADVNWALEIDFGEVKKSIDQIEVFFGVDDSLKKVTPASYSVKTSTDGEVWRTIATVTTMDKSRLFEFYPIDARYIRIIDNTSDARVMEIGEISVFQTGASPAFTDLEITDVYPVNNANAIRVDTPTFIIFNQPISDVSKIHQAFYYMNPMSGQPFPAQFSFDGTGTILKMQQLQTIDYRANYLLNINYGKLGVADKGSNVYTTDIYREDDGENIALAREIEPGVMSVNAKYYDEFLEETTVDKEREAINGIDGNLNTVAVANTRGDNDNWTYEIDLGEVKKDIREFRIYFGSKDTNRGYTPVKFSVSTSEDGIEFEEVERITADEATKKALTVVNCLPRRARFVRITSLENADTLNKMGIGELEIYTSSAPSGALLQVMSVYPQNNQSRVDVDDVVKVSFNKALSLDAAMAGISIVNAATGEVVESDYKLNASDSIVTITPKADLQEATKYKVVFDDEKLGTAVETEDVTFETVKPLSTDGNLFINNAKKSARLLDVNGGSELKYPGWENSTTYQPSHAIDSSYSTATVASGFWQYILEADLGSVCFGVNEVRVYFLHNVGARVDGIPTQYDIMVSDDGKAWETVSSVKATVETKQELGIVSFEPRNVRFIRVKDTNPSAGNAPENGIYGNPIQMTIAEVEVYRDENISEPDLAIDKVFPANGSADIAIDTNIKVSFNKAIESLDDVKDYIVLKNKFGDVIETVCSFEDESKTVVILDPVADLNKDDKYFVDIDCNAIGVAQVDRAWFETEISPSTKTNHATGGKVTYLMPTVNGSFDPNGGEYPNGVILPPSGNAIQEYAIDNDRTTASVAGMNWQWMLHLDMLELKENVNEVRVYFGASNSEADQTPQKWELLASQDGETWESIKTITYSSVDAKPKYARVTFGARDIRYIRVKDSLPTEINALGAQFQMQIGEIEVYAQDGSEPLDITVNPVRNEVGFPVNGTIVFTANQQLADDYVVTFKDESGADVPCQAIYDEVEMTLSITAKQLLNPLAQYTVGISSQSQGYDLETYFTTGDVIPEFKITTTSSTMYMEDRDNAIYPAFVDNLRYQAWTLEGDTMYFQLKTQDATGAVEWSIQSGSLPTGLSLSKDGKIAGIPTEEGMFTFSVKAVDSIGTVTTKTLTMQAKPFRAKWHTEAKFGVMIQWGSFSNPMITRPEDVYKVDERTVNFNAEEWADQIAEMGGRILNFTVAGGDGVRLWPSTSPSKLDLHTQKNYVQELIDACHARGIKFIAYMPAGFTWQPAMVDVGLDGSHASLQHDLLREVIQMGADGVWLDSNGSIGVDSYFDWDRSIAMMRYENPDFIFGSNPVAIQRSYALQYPDCDYIIHEGHYAGNGPIGQVAKWSPTTKKIGSEMDALLQDGWSNGNNPYAAENTFIDAEHVINNIRANWENGATYLAAIVAMTDGTMTTPIARPHLKEIGEWVKNNIDDPTIFGKNKRIKTISEIPDNAVSYVGFESTTGNSADMIARDEDNNLKITQGNPYNFDSYTGIEFIVGQNPITITHLGRYVLEGNDQVHRIRLMKQSAQPDVVREVTIDLSDPSTYTMGEDGFAYAEVEPITLTPNCAYYVLSSEDTSDTYAKPNVDNIINQYNVIASSPAWGDISCTRMVTNYGPGDYALSYPVMYIPSDSTGGGLTNFKAVVTDTQFRTNMTPGSFGNVTNNEYKIDQVTSHGTAFAQGAFDGHPLSFTLAERYWEWILHIDMGSVKPDVRNIVVVFPQPWVATQFKIRASVDGEHFEQIYHGTNYSLATSVNCLPDSGDTFGDIRYLEIETIKPPNANTQATPGVQAGLAEIEVYSWNVAHGAQATFVTSNNPKNEAKALDGLSFANFASDSNPLTVARSKAGNTSIKFDFGEHKDIENVKADSNNTLEYKFSLNGKDWTAVDANNIASQDGNTVVFKEPIEARYMLVSDVNGDALEIADMNVYGDKTVAPSDPGKPDPDQPPVGGGSSSGGAGGSSGSGGSDNSGDNTGEQTPTVKPGWAQNADGQWTYGADDGKATIGWAKIDGIWYHFDNEGVMQTGWIMVDSKWYYLNSSGAMVTGWRQVGASWYYLKPNGVMAVGWNLIGGKWYYMHSTGSMAFNQWINSNGKWYYVTSDGSMAVNTVIDGYTVDQNGVWVR